MKKELKIIFCLSLVLIFSFSLVSAGWFGDLFGKETGKVIQDSGVCLGISIPCFKLKDITSCKNQQGCSWGSITANAIAIKELEEEPVQSVCSGTAKICGNLGDKTFCENQQGCDWKEENDSSCNNNLVCFENALFCNLTGTLNLVEDCQHGCDKEEKKCFDISVNPITGNCIEAIKDYNNLNEDRINVVFVGFNYDNLEIFKFFVDSSIDLDSNYYGLLSIEPFKSNKNKFNFWYVDEVQYIQDLSMGPALEGSQEAENRDDLMATANSKLSGMLTTIELVCNYSNQYPIGLINSYGGHSQAAFGGTATVSFEDKHMNLGDFPSDCKSSDLNNDGCVDNKDLGILENSVGNGPESFKDCYHVSYGCNFDTIPEDDRTFYYKLPLAHVVHEFGHSFGLLNDEYKTPGHDVPIWETEGVPEENNCFDIRTEEECLESAPWKSLFGQGCGNPNIIDCTPSDERYSFEIGCFEGCAYYDSGIYRPTLLSIMGGQDATFDLDTFSIEYSYRLVNERLLCKRILKLTGSAGGYCDNFNLSSRENLGDKIWKRNSESENQENSLVH
ncbi:MAG: M64 family metallopeptidase, partial [Nanoarchaeota archaeon]|nr:M64 family metallopeptidase [Nanoarchaeota archaeon]